MFKSPVHTHTPVKVNHGKDCNQITRQIVLPLVAITASPLLVRNIFGSVLPSYRKHEPSPAIKAPEKQRAASNYFATKYRSTCLTVSPNALFPPPSQQLPYLSATAYAKESQQLTSCPGPMFFRKAPEPLSS